MKQDFQQMNDPINLHKQRLNLHSATFTRIDHDDAMVAIVYKIVRADGLPLILKICPRTEDYLREVYFLKTFSGTLPVPQVVQEIPPEDNINGAILMECLLGSLLTVTDFTHALAFDIGVQLARIHLNRVAGFGDLTQAMHLSPDPSIYFTGKFEEGLAECHNHLPETLIEKCRHYYDTHLHLLDSVDGPCIIHRDFRPGNVMTHEGKLQGIIDWASARASFAEEDFCPLEFGEWPMSPAEKKSFLAGYSSIRPVPEYDAIMPLLRLNRAVATIGFTVKHGTWSNKHARIYNFNRQFLETLS